MELSNGKETTPLSSGNDTNINVETVTETTPAERVEIENDENEPIPEIQTQKYTRQDEVIKVHLDVAQLGVTIGLVLVLIGLIRYLKIPNTYNLPSMIYISGSKKKYFSKYKLKLVTEPKIPCKGNLGAIYLLALQSGMITPVKGYFTNAELLEATDWLLTQNRIKKIGKQKNVVMYRLSKFGEQDVLSVINYINYLEYADKNGNLRDEDMEYYDILMG